MARVTKKPVDPDAVIVDEDGTVVSDPVVERTVVADPVVEPVETTPTTPVDPHYADKRGEVFAREKAEFGGLKFGSAFFGWLTALGMGVLLTAIVAAVGTALGYGADDAVVSARALGIGGAIAVAVVLFVSYLAGGYVAGRMARFSGSKQGVGVWLWAVIAAVVLALLGLAFGARFDILGNLDAFPRVPLFGDDTTIAGIITAVVFAVIALVGAVLGGHAGMRYHRRVDRAGETVVDDTLPVE